MVQQLAFVNLIFCLLRFGNTPGVATFFIEEGQIFFRQRVFFEGHFEAFDDLHKEMSGKKS